AARGGVPSRPADADAATGSRGRPTPEDPDRRADRGGGRSLRTRRATYAARARAGAIRYRTARRLPPLPQTRRPPQLAARAITTRDADPYPTDPYAADRYPADPFPADAYQAGPTRAQPLRTGAALSRLDSSTGAGRTTNGHHPGRSSSRGGLTSTRTVPHRRVVHPSQRRTVDTAAQRAADTAAQRTAGPTARRTVNTAARRMAAAPAERVDGTVAERVDGTVAERVAGTAARRMAGTAARRMAGTAARH